MNKVNELNGTNKHSGQRTPISRVLQVFALLLIFASVTHKTNAQELGFPETNRYIELKSATKIGAGGFYEYTGIWCSFYRFTKEATGIDYFIDVGLPHGCVFRFGDYMAIKPGSYGDDAYMHVDGLNGPEGDYLFMGVTDPSDGDYDLAHAVGLYGTHSGTPGDDLAVADPVEVISGRVRHGQTDIFIPCPGMPIELRNSYNSSLTLETGLGLKWQHSYGWNVARTNVEFYVGITGQGSILMRSYEIAQVIAGNGRGYELRRPTSSGVWTGKGIGEERWYGDGDMTGSFHLRTESGMDYYFASNGVVEAISNDFSQMISISHTNISGNTRVSRVEHTNGQYLQYSYADGLIDRVDTPDPNFYVSYSYDTSDRLTNILRVITGDDISSSFEYSSSGTNLLSRRINGNGETVDYTYTPTNGSYIGLSSIVGTNYMDTTFEYDVDGNSRTVSYDRGDDTFERTYNIDENTKRFSSIIHPDTNIVTTFLRHGWFHDTTLERTDDGTTGEYTVSKVSYDGRRHVASTAFGLSVEIPDTEWAYTWHATNDVLLSSTDPEGNLVEYEYTNRFLSKIKVYDTGSHHNDTHLRYSSDGLLTETENANGNKAQFYYDSYGFMTSAVPSLGPVLSMVNSRLGHVEQVSLPGSSGARVTDFHSDELGRVTNVVYPDGLTETFVYDGIGNLVESTDRAGRRSVMTYAPLGRLLSAKRVGDNYTNGTSVAYDNQFNSLSITDAGGNLVESYVLDPLDRVSIVTNLEDQDMTVSYLIAGFVDEVKRFDGSIVNNNYDERGFLTSTDYSDTTNTMTYLDNGSVSTVSNPFGVVSFTYDGASRVTGVDSVGPDPDLDYTYYPAGQVSNSISVAGTNAYSLDGADRVSSIDSPDDSFTYAYEANNGLVEQMSASGSGVTASYEYDILDRISQIEWQDDSSNVLKRFEYQYDAVGMITNITHDDGREAQYSYDHLDRLTDERLLGNGGLGLSESTYQYDAVGNRTNKTTGGASVDYTHPGSTSGNRLTEWELTSGVSSVVLPYMSVSGSANETIGVNPYLGQLWVSNATAMAASASGTNFVAVNVPTTFGTQILVVAVGDLAGNVGYASVTVEVAMVTSGAYEYDEAGCLTNRIYEGTSFTNEMSLSWDSKYQLEEVSTNGAVAETYSYDVLGRRAKLVTASDTNWFVHDGSHVVAETDSDGTLTKSYTWGPGIDNLLSYTTHSASETNTYYCLTDHLGSVHAVTDESGTVVESYEYDAWGRVIAILDATGMPLEESAVGNHYLWQGRWYSYETGLYFFRARWYDPVAGRFISKDPSGISGGLNQYVAFANNPVNFVDPFGEAPQWFNDALHAYAYSGFGSWLESSGISYGAAAAFDGINPFGNIFEDAYKDDCDNFMYGTQWSKGLGFTSSLVVPVGGFLKARGAWVAGGRQMLDVGVKFGGPKGIHVFFGHAGRFIGATAQRGQPAKLGKLIMERHLPSMYEAAHVRLSVPALNAAKAMGMKGEKVFSCVTSTCRGIFKSWRP